MNPTADTAAMMTAAARAEALALLGDAAALERIAVMIETAGPLDVRAWQPTTNDEPPTTN